MRVWVGLAMAACLAAQDKAALLGEAVAKDIRSRSKPAEATVQEYVAGVAARVAPASTAWKVETVEGDSGMWTSAVHAPGHLFVPVQALRLARSEAELAGVIARAVAGGGLRRPNSQGLVWNQWLPGAAERAAEMLAAAGYNPRALADYLNRVEKWSNVTPPAIPPGDWIDNTSAFLEAQERVRVADPARPRRRPSLFGTDR